MYLGNRANKQGIFALMPEFKSMKFKMKDILC